MKASEIGLRQAGQICMMDESRRLEFIAEGLPIIFSSAKSLIKASQTLTNFSREVEILEGHAQEECAKILILVDIVRCPPKVIASRIGPMIKWFYDHLARLIYAEAQPWKPASIKQLQEYVDTTRRSHYLEGAYSECIMPNWALFQRESFLYADVIGNEDADPIWSSPLQDWTRSGIDEPITYCIVDALEAFGIFSLPGLQILSQVWGKVDFAGDQDWGVSRTLFDELVDRLYVAKLITERAAEDHACILVNRWQMPMYRIDFSRIPVSLDELRQQREQDLPYY